MGNLTNEYINQTYPSLVKFANSYNGVSSSLQNLQDGIGDNLPIQISTTTVNISGSFLVNGQPVQANIDTGSFATTGSNVFNGNQIITGSVNITGDYLINGSPVIGPQGPQGPTGPTGAQGNQGNIGVQGPQGNQGNTGAQGNQGNTGVQGAQGNTGLTGPTGPQGNQGNTGAQGNQGTQGNQGSQGPIGPQGNQGNTGAQGNQGTQGDIGPTGPQGNQGDIGPQGNQGNVGAQGNQGNTGPQGNQGNTGAQGNQGDIGPQGNQGATGPTPSFDSGSYATTGSNQFSGSQEITGALTLVYYDQPYDSYFKIAELGAPSGDYFQFNSNVEVDGGNLTVGGDIKGNFITDKDGTNVLTISGSQGVNVTGSVKITAPTGTPLTIEHNDATPNQNTLIGFIDSGSAVWSIGNSGINDNFIIYNPDTFTTPLSIGQDNKTTLYGGLDVTGSVNITGELTALSASITYLETIYQTSSVIYSSGSNILGDESGDTQTLWGTVSLPSGPLSVTGSVDITGQYLINGSPVIGPQGPQGSTGPQGNQGNTGAQGNQGNVGPVGPQGNQGNTGATGAQGNQGNTGAQGDIGPQGNQGNTGPIGPQGNQGNTGAQGNQGNTGSQGDTGAQGNTGPTGPQGNQGDTGATGPQGNQGNTGAQGNQGNIGPIGPQGNQGNTGGTGPQGNQGNTGAQGPIGPTPSFDSGSYATTGSNNFTGNQNIASGSYLQTDGITNAGPSENIEIAPQSSSDVIVNLSNSFNKFIVKSQAALDGYAAVVDITGSLNTNGSVNLKGLTSQLSSDVLVIDTLTGAIGYNSGAVGPQGPQGNTGAAGPQGNQGNTGATGPQGNQGNTGGTGPQGNQGNTGPQGTSGVATFPFTGSAVITGSLIVTGSITSTSDITANNTLISAYSSGDEGGEIKLALAQTSTTLTGSVTIDVNGNRVRIFETGGTNRGGYFDIAGLAASVGTNLAAGGSPFPYTGSAVITGSLSITGSINGSVNALSISSNTASLNLSNGDFFTLQLVSGSNTFINPSNIKAGQTINMLLSTTGSATVSFPTTVKQAGSFPYTPTPTTSKDIITLVSFDGTNLYLTNVKNLI